MGFFQSAYQTIRSRLAGDPDRIRAQTARAVVDPASLPVFGNTDTKDPRYALMSAGSPFRGSYARQNIVARYRDYSEMNTYSELSTALNIYADDATQIDSERNRVIWVESPMKGLELELNNLLKRRLRLDEEAWTHVRGLCMNGNHFREVLLGNEGVIGLGQAPVKTIRRIEDGRRALLGFIQTTEDTLDYDPGRFLDLLERTRKNPGTRDGLTTAFEPWEMIHFRFMVGDDDDMYGSSVLEPARDAWRQVRAMEDTAVLFRLQKGVDRYAFYVNTGKLPQDQALQMVDKVRQRYRKRNYIDPATGRLMLTSNNLSPLDDFWIPSIDGTDSTRIEVINPPQWQAMDDVEYFKDRLFGGVAIPKAYIAQSEDATRAVLSSLDVKFARTVLRVQKAYRMGIDQSCRIHIAALDRDPNDYEFSTRMTVPSSIFELAQLEVRATRADLASRLGEIFPVEYIFKHVYNIPDAEIPHLINAKQEDMLRNLTTDAKGQAMAQKLVNDAMPEEPAPNESHQARRFEAKRLIERAHARMEARKPFAAKDMVGKVAPNMEAKLVKLLANDKHLATKIDRVSSLMKGLHQELRASNRSRSTNQEATRE